MFKFLRKAKSYIYSKFFTKKRLLVVGIDTAFTCWDMDLAAKGLADAIDRDILEKIYEKANHEMEKAIMDNLCFGKLPKIFVRPAVLETENHVTKITLNWGIES